MPSNSAEEIKDIVVKTCQLLKKQKHAQLRTVLTNVQEYMKLSARYANPVRC